MNSIKLLSAGIFSLLLNYADAQDHLSAADEEQWKTDIATWKTNRLKDLRSVSSPLNIVGIYALKPGENSFGNSKKDVVVIPSADLPADAGIYRYVNDSITVSTKRSSGVLSKGRPALVTAEIPSPEVNALPADSSIILEHGSLSWIVQLADGKPVVRVRDRQSRALKKFTTTEFYPLNPQWRVKARYQEYVSPTTIGITTVFGTTSQKKAAGVVIFSVDNKEYRLEALDRGSQLFFTFSDRTGDSTSYAFRFLYVPKPSSGNKEFWLDFNKATNPNCAFSPYTPCPLPPKQNILPLAINAGEKKFHLL